MKGQLEIPQTSEEFEEFLHDDARFTDVLKNGQFAEFTQAYIAKAMDDQRQELATQMREQLETGKQKILQDWAEQGMTPANGFRPGGTAPGKKDARRAKIIARAAQRLPAAEFQAEKQYLFGPSAMGSEFDDESFAGSMRAFMFEVWKAEKIARDQGDTERLEKVQDAKRRLYQATAARPQNASMSERLPAEGGYLVPEILRSEIMMIALEQSVIRPRARTIPMDSLRVPLPAIDDTSHASNVYGGVAAFWTAEGAALSATAPKWAQITLEARKLTAYTTIPNELLQDAITNLDTWFNMFFPRAVAYFEDIAFIGGTGVGEPQGFLNSPAAVKVATQGSQGTLQFSDIASAYTRMWPASLNSALWLCSPDTLNLLLNIAVNANGAGGSAVAPPGFLTQMQAIEYPGGGNGDGVNYRLLGRPLIVSEKLPAAGGSSAGALSFVDLDYYLLGDRQSLQIATSEDYLFASDLVAYRAIERVDGRIWQQSAITPQNGSSNTLSPVVLVDTSS